MVETGDDGIRYESAGGTAVVTLDRPARRNAVTYGMIDRLVEVFDAVDADDEVRAVIVTGSGEFFSAGTDLSGAAGRSAGAGAGDGFSPGTPGFKPLRGGTRDVGGELAIRIFDCTKPVIAAVNGTAVGIGITMILPMDIRIAADTARFTLPFTRRGIVPESCATWFLPRVVGISRAVDWAVTGRVFPASEALEAGLVRELVPPGDVLARARQIAAEIATQTAPISVALTRQMMWKLLGAPHPIEANRLESKSLLAVQRTADTAEGVASFLEKRAPNFTLRPTRDLPDFYPWWDELRFDP
jgi:enoyl-CoA hydratase/carnithine racemase